MGLLKRILGVEERPGGEERADNAATPITMHDWHKSFAPGQQFNFNGQSYQAFQLGVGTSSAYYDGNAIVYACEFNRIALFSEARFQWQRLKNGRPGDLFSSPELSILEEPWPGATTRDLLVQAELDVMMYGNSYWIRDRSFGVDQLVWLNPQYVKIITEAVINPLNGFMLGERLLGYAYSQDPDEISIFAPTEIAHYKVTPSSRNRYVGQSWLSPCLPDVDADQHMTDHKRAILRNQGQLGYVITHDDLNEEDLERFRAAYEASHGSAATSGRPLILGGGADVKTVGQTFEQLAFKATQGAGEPLALDTPVPTPTGWTTMGEIQPGDQVIGRDGLPANVLAVSPVHTGRECYRVTFDDGSSIVADAGHIWTAIDRNTRDRAERNYTTEQLYALTKEWEARGDGGNRIAIPAGRAAKLPEVDLLVDPYVLGAWLGGGQTAVAAICGASVDLEFIAEEVERRGYPVTKWAAQPSKAAVIGVSGGLRAALSAVGVLEAKRIPDEYLRASLDQRLDLLRGLMDTAGAVGSRGMGACEVSCKDERLARQVAELVRSLGCRAALSRKVDGRSRTGECWRVTFRAGSEANPFLLPRKAGRCITPVGVKNRAVVSVEPVESVPVRCIAVDTADHLFYAGEGWVLTHNTRIAACSGIQPAIIGLSEGMSGSTLNAGNFAAARRVTADRTLRPMWGAFASAISVLVDPPGKDRYDAARLWYDDRDIPFLREDVKDQVEIQQKQVTMIRNMIDVGFEEEAAVEAIVSGDLIRLQGRHTGLFSVQLQPPVTKAHPEGVGTDPSVTPHADQVTPHNDEDNKPNNLNPKISGGAGASGSGGAATPKKPAKKKAVAKPGKTTPQGGGAAKE